MANSSSIYEDLVVGGNLRIGGTVNPLLPRTSVLAQAALQSFPVPLSRFRTHGDVTMVAGTGISSGSGTVCEHSVYKSGGLIKTEILVDVTGLNDGGANGDIIGKDGGTLNCHIGQITAAVNGTIIAGRIHCLEVPAGGNVDIDLWGSVDEATGAQDAAISSLTGEEQITNHGDWAANEIDEFNNMPDADGYLYLANGTKTDDDYTGGIFLIEMWGTPATNDLQYVEATFGTNAPSLQTPDFGGNAVATSYYARAEIPIPWEYEDGETLTLRVSAGMLTTVPDQSATVDVAVYESDGDSTSTGNLCATTAVTDNMKNLVFQDVDFTITPTNVAPGDLLDVRITVTVDDDGDAGVMKGCIGFVQLLCDVR